MAPWAASCDRPLGKEAYLAEVTSYERGLRVKREAFGYSFEAQYKPLDFVLLSQAEGKMTESEYRERLGRLGETVYIDLEVASLEQSDLLGASLSERQSRLYRFSYGFGEDVSLETGSGASAPCSAFHFERPNGIRRSGRFLLAFDAERLGQSPEITLVIDSEALGTGPVKLRIDRKNAPKLARNEIIIQI